jgi:hypothetical protein
MSEHGQDTDNFGDESICMTFKTKTSSIISGSFGGADGSRTHDLLNAIQALSQLSYGPTIGRTE